MATSSITHNFFITTREGAELFVKALDEAEIEKANRIEPTGPRNWRMVTDEKELREIMEKWKEKHAGKVHSR